MGAERELDYTENEGGSVAEDHIWIEHRRLGGIRIHREGRQGTIPVKEEQGREEGKQYLWVIYYLGIKWKSLTGKFSLIIASWVQHRCGRCLDFAATLLGRCMSLDTGYIFSALRCLSHQKLPKLRTAEENAASPFQSYAHMHRVEWLAKWPPLWNLSSLCPVMLGLGCWVSELTLHRSWLWRSRRITTESSPN